MFHRLSKAFDEGGVKGLLMANMRVSSSSCTLAFECNASSKSGAADNENVSIDGKTPADEASNNECDQSVLDKSMGQIVTKVPFGGEIVSFTSAPEEIDDSVVDITDIIKKCGFSVDDISSSAICPSLDAYRHALDVKDSSVGLFDASQFNAYFPSSSKLSLAPPVAIISSNQPVSADMIDDDCDCDGPRSFDDDCDDDAYGVGGEQPSTPAKTSATPAGTPGTGKRASFGATKIHWDTVFNDDPSAAAGNENVGNNAVSLNDGIISHSEYTFFDMDMLCKSNAWAGVKHWRLATRSQARMAAQSKNPPAAASADDAVALVEESLEEEAAAAAGKKSAAKKDKYVIDFASDFLCETLFVAPNNNSTTTMTKAAMDKAVNLREELFLPADAKMQAKDLARLFLCHQMLLPPPELQRVLLAAPNKSWRFKRNFLGVPSSSSAFAGDMMWGEAEQVVRGAASSFAATAAAFIDMPDDDDHDDGGYTYNDDNDDYRVDTLGAPQGQEEDSDSLQINTTSLLQAKRVVDKVDIGYCTIAKRVNVRKLKTDIWSHIDSNVKEHADKKAPTKRGEVDAENTAPANNMNYLSGESDDLSKVSSTQTEQISFQELVKDIGANQNQREVTLPFYFICLLHLANEKTLKIDGNANMNDLVISKDI